MLEHISSSWLRAAVWAAALAAGVACHRAPDQNAQSQAAERTDGYSIRPHVLDSNTKLPVPGAEISLRRDDGTVRSGVTDAQGQFVGDFPFSSRTHVELDIKKPGYMPYIQQIFRGRGDFEVLVYLHPGEPKPLVRPHDSAH